MANNRSRGLTRGGSSYTLMWRDPETGHKTRTFSNKDYAPGEAKDKALELKAFLDANGNSFKLAAKAKVRKDSTAPTVYEAEVRHIDLLRKPPAWHDREVPQHGGRAHRRQRPRQDAGGQVNKAAVIDWLDQLTVKKGANRTVDAPLSRKTKQNIHALLSAAFVTAMDADAQPRQGGRGGRPQRGARGRLPLA